MEVVGSFAAFAALREDGEIITWGHPGAGGDLTQGGGAPERLSSPWVRPGGEPFRGLRPRA